MFFNLVDRKQNCVFATQILPFFFKIFSWAMDKRSLISIRFDFQLASFSVSVIVILFWFCHQKPLYSFVHGCYFSKIIYISTNLFISGWSLHPTILQPNGGTGIERVVEDGQRQGNLFPQLLNPW